MADKKYHFEKLTPVDSINLDIYEEAINYVFENDDVKNIAISGAYSAGKSSVLASYKKKHNDLSFLHISLAHFKSPEQEEDTKVSESVLEGKILNQLIHQIPADKIPQTNFRVKKKCTLMNIVKSAIKIVLFFVFILYFACFNKINSFVTALPDNWVKSTLSFLTNQYSLIVFAILSIGLFSIFTYGFIKIQKNKNVFRKLSFQGNEIEIFEESDDSYFDKYLNEVLYLFENAEADVIVFEDMDRFNANRIFERLREVNTLANIQLKKDNKKVLRFFYLLRDDIFVSKDRTKFFDYIIPIVPVVDSSNSYDQFISHFKKSGTYEKFDENFLQGLSLYIDDMRLLKNIYNEFLIYYSRLNTIELDCNRMLALIAYKNLFPRDFADLQLNQGFIFTLFNNRDVFIAEETERLKQLISKKQHEIENANSEHLISIRELDVAYEDKKPIQYGNRQGLSAADQEKYIQRKQALENRLNNKIPQLEKEKTILEQEFTSTQNKQLCDIITRDNIRTIFSITSKNEIGQETTFNEIKSSEYFDLLKYLIRNGYIDETYADYMTYFYENSLSRIDKTFLRSITDKKAKEYTYQLKNPQLVVSRLRLMDFDQEEILNFDLFTHLLHIPSNVNYIERFIEQLKDTKNFKFIGMYFNITTEMSAYIKNLNLMWPELFFVALNEQTLPEEQIRRYSIYTLYYSDDNAIKLINRDNCLCDYISNARDYLAIDKPNIDRLINRFILLGVSFKGFEYAKSDKALFRAVYKNSLYEINAENLQLIQKEILGIIDDGDIAHKNYTILYTLPDSEITQYVNQNIDEYFNVILKMCSGTIRDDENVAVAVLNFAEISRDHKHSYISALQTTIESIKEVTDSSLWSLLLNSKIVEYSEQNIIDCFVAIELDESVIAYINRCNVNLDFSKNEYDDKTKEALFDAVIVSNTMENSKYEQILVSLGFYYNEFTIADIDEDKISILINTSIIKMTSKTLVFMRENYSTVISEFIYKNIDEYVDIMDSNLFSQEELLEILSFNVKDNLKIKLLEFSKDALSVIDKPYSDKIIVYVINHNLCEEDRKVFFEKYDQYSCIIQAEIQSVAIEYINEIIDNQLKVHDNLISVLLQSNITRDQKISLFTESIPNLNETTCMLHFDELNLSGLKRIFDKSSGRRNYEKNDEVKIILDALRENTWIYEYHEDERNKNKYVVIKNRPRNKEPEFLD